MLSAPNPSKPHLRLEIPQRGTFRYWSCTGRGERAVASSPFQAWLMWRSRFPRGEFL